jgi:hypothetical protein
MHILRGVDYQVAHKKALKLRWLFADPEIGWGFNGGFMKNFWVLLVLCFICFAGSFFPHQVSAKSCTLECKQGMFFRRVWTEVSNTCIKDSMCLADKDKPCPCNCLMDPTCVNRQCDAQCVSIRRNSDGTGDHLGMLADGMIGKQQQPRSNETTGD